MRRKSSRRRRHSFSSSTAMNCFPMPTRSISCANCGRRLATKAVPSRLSRSRVQKQSKRKGGFRGTQEAAQPAGVVEIGDSFQETVKQFSRSPQMPPGVWHPVLLHHGGSHFKLFAAGNNFTKALESRNLRRFSGGNNVCAIFPKIFLSPQSIVLACRLLPNKWGLGPSGQAWINFV